MHEKPDDFFVGYQPLSVGQRRSLAVAAFTVIALAAVLAAATALGRSAPAATRITANASVVGRFDARGYGVLIGRDERGRPSPILLSRGGKFGTPPRLRELDGRVVRLTGLLLEREGVQLLEVYQIDEQPKLHAQERARYGGLAAEAGGVVRARGEIVDLKCWLGRMKPGDGRTHRACAQLCIAGGMPPALMTSHSGPFVLVGKNGEAINDEVIPFVAEAVELEGALERIGTLSFLKIDPRAIRRL